VAGFVEIMTIAFIAQLAVLPGEKVQFIIAGLATRYDPLVVVAAAGSAFAGWTALEIAFGQTLRRLLPGIVLDGITATLFLLFAVLLVRSAPAPGEGPSEADPETHADGGHELLDLPFGLENRVPGGFGGFVPIFLMMAAGEFGDKTQLITISLAVQYGATPAIWAGEMLAIIPVSLANAYFFDRFVHRVDMRKAHFASAALFAFFGVDTVLSVVVDFSVWETVVSGITSLVV
jgi:putative Ca2+/H+ antiporter (TMEM165/GDT1 family)